jgi:hypothetical protein
LIRSHLASEWLDSNGKPFVKQALKKALGDAVDLSDLDALQRRVSEVFESMDVDGGGTLDILEVQEGMAKLGLKMELAEVEELIAEVDDNGNGELELSEFTQARTACNVRHEPTQHGARPSRWFLTAWTSSTSPSPSPSPTSSSRSRSRSRSDYRGGEAQLRVSLVWGLDGDRAC